MVSYPSMTKTLHNDTYPAIDPRQRPELSVKGKTVIITGGGGNIGRGLAQAFADAGASRIAIIDWREDKLLDTKHQVKATVKGIEITTHIVNIIDPEDVKRATDDIGEWDILLSNAGYLSKVQPLLDADIDDWWKCFEVNVRGNFNVIHSFLPKRKSGGILIGTNAGSIQVSQMQAKFSAYNASKFAALKTLEVVAVENPDLHVVSMHPGIVQSDMTAKTGLPLPRYDTPELPGHFAVWLCSDEAKFLRGRFAWSNWDVNELKAKREAFENTELATSNCVGWPYSP